MPSGLERAAKGKLPIFHNLPALSTAQVNHARIASMHFFLVQSQLALAFCLSVIPFGLYWRKSSIPSAYESYLAPNLGALSYYIPSLFVPIHLGCSISFHDS